MNDTHRQYNHKFWKPLDYMVVNDANYFHLSSTLLSINLKNNSAVVKTMLERDQLLLPLSSLERVYQTRDHVRIAADPNSNPHNVHHHNIGKFRLVTEVDSVTGEVTFLDSEHAPVGSVIRCILVI